MSELDALAAVLPKIWVFGGGYDKRRYGTARHLAVYPRRGFYEAAWETTEMDPDRLYAIDRSEYAALSKLAARLQEATKVR